MGWNARNTTIFIIRNQLWKMRKFMMAKLNFCAKKQQQANCILWKIKRDTDRAQKIYIIATAVVVVVVVMINIIVVVVGCTREGCTAHWVMIEFSMLFIWNNFNKWLSHSKASFMYIQIDEQLTLMPNHFYIIS